MIITYFDEVKYEVGRSQYYWIGGLAATPGAIWNLEQGVSEISRDVFGTICASKDTEFHAADIFHRKRNFKSRDDLDNRITVLERLISVIDSQDEIGKIYVRVEPEAMVKPEYEEIAFMFFVEKVESYLVLKKEPGILIGDRENDRVSGKFADALSSYRTHGTSYHFGVELNHLLDTVHFTHSHHSRMLQLADVYICCQQAAYCTDAGKYPRCRILRYLRECSRLLIPNRYKEWPTNQSWLQVF